MDVPDRYEFKRALTPGGMSAVSLYHDKHLDRDVIIKIVAPGENYRRAMDEIAALERLRSDYVVDVYDVIVDNKTREIGIVQAFLDGIDLADVFGRTDFDETARLEILYQLADALREIHSADVIHRDVKPQNTKLLGKNRVVLFDFGLARLATTGNETHGFVGSTGYAAPELFSDGYVQFTKAVDIYALGAIGYFLVNRRGLPHITTRHNTTELITPGNFTSQRVVQTLNQALSVGADNRPSAEDIRDVLAGELLKDRHRALLIGPGQARLISSENRAATLRVKGQGEIRVEYDGYEFTVVHLDGVVFSNNTPLGVGSVLSGCSVLTLGTDGAFRTFITFDVSNPEVLIQ